VILVAAAGLACHRQRAESDAASTAEVLLTGAFEHAAKPAEGEAEIVRRGDDYELRLRRVRVASDRPVRVYLVGAERASTTRSVVEAELKYDMEDLKPGLAEQVIALPSEPDSALRSVVLWDPAFSVNLAFAALRRLPGRRVSGS
jgi:hypothetical protein